MSDTLEALLSLCWCLRPAEAHHRSAEADQVPASDQQWSAVINLASAHYLAPALWLALQERNYVEYLPADAKTFLAEAHRLNVVRNTRIRDQAIELLAAFGNAGIKTVLMKGGAYLFEGDERAFQVRMLLDLDLLVPEAQLRQSVQVAAGLGYQVSAKTDEIFQHLDAMVRNGDLASIELHRHVGMQRSLLPAEDVLEKAIRVDAEGVSVYLPTPSQRAIHNIFHSEVQAQNNYALGHIPLRYLHDLMLLRSQHEPEIDWHQVQTSLNRLDYGYLLSGYLYLAHRLLGLSMPVPVTDSARRHFRWCMAQLEWPALRALVSILGTMAHPFRRPPAQYVYGEHGNPIRMALHRLRHAWYLARSQRVSLFTKLLRIVRRMHSHQ